MSTYPVHPLVALLALAMILGTALLSIAAYRRRSATASPEPFLFGRVLRGWYVAQLDPLEERLLLAQVSPAALTWAQLVAGVGVALLYAYGWIFTAGWILLMSGTLDILDGRLARRLNTADRRGAFFDSVTDRYVDGLVFAGLAFLFRDSPPLLLTILLAALGTQMISYSRARSEALGLECRIGWLQRPERYVLLGFGSLFGSIYAHCVAPFAFGTRFLLFDATLVAITVLVNLTALQRIVWIWRRLPQEAV